MIIIRVGRGRSSNGALLDRDTEWYNIDNYDKAIASAKKKKKSTYISSGHGYREISLEEIEMYVKKYPRKIK